MKKIFIILLPLLYNIHFFASPFGITSGGFDTTSLAQYNVIIGNDTSPVNFAAPSVNSNIPLVSQGPSSDPIFGVMNIAGGGTGLSTTTPYAIMTGGTTSMGQITNLGVSGQVLTSDDAGTVPVWVGQIQQATVTLTSAQVKSLFATPITIVAAPGSGYAIQILSAVIKKKYGGTNAWTAGASQVLNLNYTGQSGVVLAATILSNAAITSTDDRIATNTTFISDSGTTYTTIGNQPLVILNPVSTEISGNAANNNTIVVSVLYVIVPI